MACFITNILLHFVIIAVSGGQNKTTFPKQNIKGTFGVRCRSIPAKDSDTDLGLPNGSPSGYFWSQMPSSGKTSPLDAMSLDSGITILHQKEICSDVLL